ncbi:MAG: diaminopimelate decarboxylase [Anaerolineae bacterium]
MEHLALFPITTRIENDELTIGEHSLAALAEEFGTPLYVYDRATMDAAAQAYLHALQRYYPAKGEVTYAGKAYLSVAVARWVREIGLWLDCTGEGEIAFALAAGMPRERILVHGVNKSVADLQAALRYAGTIVIDHLDELERLAALWAHAGDETGSGPGKQPELWLRFLPGLAVSTHHAHTQTGQQESKFGMNPAEIRQAAQFCQEQGLPLQGLHFHQGSNFRDAEPLLPALEMALGLAREIGFAEEWHLSPGGGWGVAYHEGELPHPPIESYVQGIAEAVVEGCREHGLSLPHLHLEPGRSLVARAGVAIYRVGAIKRRAGKTWVLVDGGLADNPRYALYGARYACLTVAGVGRERSERVVLGGPYCESGDVLAEDVLLPAVRVGELLAVPVSGAYQLSMSSNYNGARRPAVLWLEEGRVRLIQRRETVEDLLRREVGES